MFNNLTDRFKSAFRNLTGRGKLTEANIQDAMAEIRTALKQTSRTPWPKSAPPCLTPT